ncbi:MAG: ABC transporter permease [Clostridiaceae bacterium]
MISFIALLKNDIRLFLRDWKACVLLLAAPLLFISLFTCALSSYLNKSSFIEPFPVALVDMEDTTQTRMLAKQLEEISIFSEVQMIDEDEAIQKLSEKSVGGIVILPPDFTASVAAGENEPVTVIGSSAMPLEAYIVKNVIQSAANLVSAAQSAIITIYHYDKLAGISGKELDIRYNNAISEYLMEALARNNVFSYNDSVPQYGVTPVEYFTAALIVIFMMFTGMPGMKMLVTEKSMGVARRLSATAVAVWKVILSKLMISALLLILQFGVIIVFTSVLFHNYWGAPVKNILLLFGGLIFAVSAWSVFVASVSSTPAAADMIGSLGILLTAVAGGNIYPLTSMPEWIRSLSKLTMSRWAMDGFIVLFSGNDAASTGIYALMLTVIGVVLFCISIGMMNIVRRG